MRLDSKTTKRTNIRVKFKNKLLAFKEIILEITKITEITKKGIVKPKNLPLVRLSHRKGLKGQKTQKSTNDQRKNKLLIPLK